RLPGGHHAACAAFLRRGRTALRRRPRHGFAVSAAVISPAGGVPSSSEKAEPPQTRPAPDLTPDPPLLPNDHRGGFSAGRHLLSDPLLHRAATIRLALARTPQPCRVDRADKDRTL